MGWSHTPALGTCLLHAVVHVGPCGAGMQQGSCYAFEQPRSQAPSLLVEVPSATPLPGAGCTNTVPCSN